MKVGTIVDVLSAIVGVALVTALVNGNNTAGVISSAGNAFAGALSAALGK